MVRNPAKKPETETSTPEDQEAGNVQVVERVVNLELINNKLNYLTGICVKIAEACKIDLEQL